MSVVLFLAVLFVLVLVHELGHFAVAKWTKMRVDEFGIGFPPKLFAIKKGETEYSLNMLPIGGFVKIYGEDSIGIRDDVDNTRSFVSKNRWAQASVLVAGVTMNILFAWFLMTIAFNVGVNTPVSESEAGPNAQLTITQVLPGSPADEAGIVHGSIIKSVQAGDDEKLTTFTPSAFSEFVGTRPYETLTMAYSYNGELNVVQISARKGIIENEKEQPAIGVALTQIDVVKRSFIKSFTDAFIYTLTGLRDISVGIGMLIWDSLHLNADFTQIAGPVGIVGLVGEASTYGLTTLLMFTAFISLNLAVINILPFPALDGGRLLLVGIEAMRRKPIKPEFIGTLNAIGFILLILLMIAVTWNDIARLI
jgi:regulator of sigma E protease